jgi:hypothetical protein
MASKEIILRSAGLSALKPVVYRAGLRQPLPVGGGDYDEQEASTNTRMNTGGQDAEILSSLGTPVWADLTLRADETTEEELNIQTVLLTVDQSKNIVQTAVQGRNGTVKEYVSTGDYIISIRGALVGAGPGDYPEQQVKLLLDLVEINASIVAVSPFLQLFRIFNVVVSDFRFEQLQGFQNMQVFEITCLSDEPIELIEDV